MKKYVKVIKRVLLTASVIGICILTKNPVHASSGVVINAANFPDSYFRQYVLNNCDSNKDNILSAEEIEGKTSISIWDENIKNLKGIEYFTKLESLSLDDIQASSIDLTKFTNLAEFDCSYCNFTKFDFTKCSKIKKIDITGCKSLATLSLGSNLFLTDFSCGGTNVATLDFSKTTALTAISIYNCEKLSTLDISKCSNIESLNLEENKISKIVMGQGSKVSTVYIENSTAISGIDFSKYPNMEELTITVPGMSKLDLSSNKNLVRLVCNRCGLNTLNITGLTKLEYLVSEGNSLTALNVSGLKSLQEISCSDNKFTSLDFGNNSSLKNVDVSDNSLASIDINECKNVESLNVSNNKLSYINLCSLQNLKYLQITNNNISALDISEDDELEYIAYSGNPLIGLDLSSKYSGDKADTTITISKNVILENDVIKLDFSSYYDFNYTKVTVSSAQKGKVTVTNDGFEWKKMSDVPSQLVYTYNTGSSKFGKLTVRINLSTSNISADKVDIAKSSIAMKAGESYTLKTKAYAGNTEISGIPLSYTSSNTKIATVNSNGKVTAKKSGTVTITAKTKDGKVKDTCKVTIKYKLTYNHCYSGSKNFNYTYSGASEVKLISATRKGYRFDGWYTNKNYTKKVTKITKGSHSNITLYAKWTKVSSPVTKVTSIKSPKKGWITLTLKSVKCNWYEISYSTSKKFTKGTTKVLNASKTTKTICGLKSGKTYYVRVRSYTYDDNKNRTYSKYSQIVKIKVK